jgi:hypothetical protein
MYEKPSSTAPLTQGDIIDGCPFFDVATSSDSPDARFLAVPTEGRVIVLTQACDLAQAKTTRTVVAVMHAAAELVARRILKASTIRDSVSRNQQLGWYFLQAARTDIGLPESIVDLRDLHTVPRKVLETLVVRGKRIGRLATPYREHLAQHFAITYMRIGLPEPHKTAPDSGTGHFP